MSTVLPKIASYQENEFGNLKDHYQTLKSSQSPHTLFITCSDSRLCPQEFTQTQAGELFVIRNAGNLIPDYDAENPSNEGLTLEYGVCALNIGEIVVCGHASCGAMGGVMDVEKLTSLPLVHKGLKNYKEANLKEIEECNGLDELISWNVMNQLQTLMGYPFIHERVTNGTLELNGAVYDFVNAELVHHSHVDSSGKIIQDES